MGIIEKHHEHWSKINQLLTEFNVSIDEDEQRQRSDLQQKDDKIDFLELQVQLLKSNLAEVNRRVEEPRPSAALEGSAEGILRFQYDALAHEYERVTKARSILESRCRRYKEILQEWRDYCKLWIEKKGPRSTAPEPALSPVSRAREEAGDSEAPAPPVPASNITPTPPERETESQHGQEFRLSRAGERKERLASQETSGSGIEGIIDQRATEVPYLQALEGSKATRISKDGNSRPTTADSTRGSNGSRALRPTRELSTSNHVDDDSPVVVSERAVKRKRTSVKAEPEMSIHVDNSIKVEARLESPILEVSSHAAPRVQDSLDLDDVGRSFDTPRKRRRLECMRILSKYGADIGGRILREDEDGVQRYRKRLDEEAEGDQVHAQGSDPQSRDSRLKRFHKLVELNPCYWALSATQRKDYDDRVLGPQVSSPLLDWPTTASESTPKARHTYGRSSEPRNHAAILGPKDPNILPRTSHRKPRSVAPSRGDAGAAAVSILAEDGDAFTPSRCLTGATQMLDTPRKLTADGELRSAPSNVQARLDNLMQHPSSVKGSFLQNAPNLRSSKELGSPKTPINIPKGPSVHRAHHQCFTSPRRKSATAEPLRRPPQSEQAVRKYLINTASPLDSPPPIHPDHEALRARPVSHLRLSDFKLNKSHTEYAYHEFIRKHDEKRKVGGCTDPFCDRCREIARFATLTDFHPPQNPTLFGSSPPASAQAAEDALLVNFLGGGHEAQARLDRMAAVERRETLQKAREKSFADLYGRHRQMHQRAVSPPGYWETEFPSTQQEMENREAAKAIERVRVKERWEDALRGGKWKFADE